MAAGRPLVAAAFASYPLCSKGFPGFIAAPHKSARPLGEACHRSMEGLDDALLCYASLRRTICGVVVVAHSYGYGLLLRLASRTPDRRSRRAASSRPLLERPPLIRLRL